MRKALVVIHAIHQDVLDHLSATRPTAAQQVAFSEGFKQRLGLIEPRGIDRCEQNMKTRRQVTQEGRRVVTHVAGPIVDDQMDPLGPPIGMQEPAYRWAKVFAVVFVQALRPHASVVDGQAGQHNHRAMSFVFELLALYLTRLHPLSGPRPFQNLEVGFLIGAQDDFAAPPQALRSLVIPKDFQGSLHRFVIPDRSLPVAKTMRGQVGVSQQGADGGVMNGLDILFLHSSLRQRSVRPMRHVPTDRGGCLAGQVLNPLTLTCGKKRAAR